MEKEPFLSICIPTYNQTKYLEKCLNSILNQSYKDFELIISDDSTTEDVFFLIKNFSIKTNLKVFYYRNKPSLGSPKNWDYAISKAKGKWIKIMHHDEWFYSDFALQKFVDRAEISDQSFIFSGIQGIHINLNKRYINLPTGDFTKQVNNDPFKLLKANHIGPPSCILFPKSNLFFDENIKWLVDIDFYIRLIIDCNYKVEYIHEVLIENCMDEHNITNKYVYDMELQLFEYIYLLNKYSRKMNIKQKLLYFIHTYFFLKSFKQQNSFILLLRLLKKRIYVQ